MEEQDIARLQFNIYPFKTLQRLVSVASACYLAGFNNLANFNEQFKKFLKVTPYQFKQKNNVY